MKAERPYATLHEKADCATTKKQGLCAASQPRSSSAKIAKRMFE